MKAIFEVSFKAKNMCDRKTLKEEYNNSWFKLIKFLFEEEGLGIFDENFTLKKVIKK